MDNLSIKGTLGKVRSFLISPILLSWFPNLLQKSFPRSISNHCPILLGFYKVDWGPCPFRFFNHWLENKSMMSDAMEGWKRCTILGSAGLILSNKVKATKRRLKSWSNQLNQGSFE